MSAGIDFRGGAEAKTPAATAAARLRHMKALAGRFKGIVTRWNAADFDNGKLHRGLRYAIEVRRMYGLDRNISVLRSQLTYS